MKIRGCLVQLALLLGARFLDYSRVSHTSDLPFSNKDDGKQCYRSTNKFERIKIYDVVGRILTRYSRPPFSIVNFLLLLQSLTTEK
jgi:hypothetical protein